LYCIVLSTTVFSYGVGSILKLMLKLIPSKNASVKHKMFQFRGEGRVGNSSTCQHYILFKLNFNLDSLCILSLNSKADTGRTQAWRACENILIVYYGLSDGRLSVILFVPIYAALNKPCVGRISTYNSRKPSSILSVLFVT